MFELKQLSHGSVPNAMAKVERYRLLNEPFEAESICEDILAIEPDNQRVQVALVLCLTDQIHQDASAAGRALEVASRLAGEYERFYYSGIVWERKAKARYQKGGYGTSETVYGWVRKAMDLFAESERLRQAGDDDAILRWNACVRFLKGHPEVSPPPPAEAPQPILSE